MNQKEQDTKEETSIKKYESTAAQYKRKAKLFGAFGKIYSPNEMKNEDAIDNCSAK